MNSLLLIQLESSESVGTIVFSLINQRKIKRRDAQAKAAAAASGEAEQKEVRYEKTNGTWRSYSGNVNPFQGR